jgi:hypothetical protein
LRTFCFPARVSLRPGSLGFNPDAHTSLPFNSASEAFELHPDVRFARTERSSSDGTTLVGAMLESGDGEEVDVVKSAAERCPKVDVDALKKCATVEDALALVAAA